MKSDKTNKNKKVNTTSPAAAAPVIGSVDGLFLSSINITIFGYRVTASQLAITKVSKESMDAPEEVGCHCHKR